jgi:aspartyl-tRNA(Asn)/glutamyl-tRNA(Gln) amidotransferase subunit C
VAVSEKDVRHIAQLARVGLTDEQIPALVGELNGILGHIDVLQKAHVRSVPPATGIGTGGTPLRADDGPPIPLARPHESFAPDARDGFLLVPRLATHEALGNAADDVPGRVA